MNYYDKYSKPPYLLYSIVSGSRAYGLNRPDSDTDIRGVFLADPRDDWSLGGAPEGVERKDPDNGVDTDLWEVSKYLRLLSGCNPNIIETLWVDEAFIKYIHPNFNLIRMHRDKFLSKKAETTFLGYAVAQMKKFDHGVAINDINWKNAMHCIRLLMSVESIFSNGYPMVKVPPCHVDFLMSIRHGKIHQDTFLKLYEKGIAHVRALAEKSKFPDSVDEKFVNSILYDMKMKAVEIVNNPLMELRWSQ